MNICTVTRDWLMIWEIGPRGPYGYGKGYTLHCENIGYTTIENVRTFVTGRCWKFNCQRWIFWSGLCQDYIRKFWQPQSSQTLWLNIGGFNENLHPVQDFRFEYFRFPFLKQMPPPLSSRDELCEVIQKRKNLDSISSCFSEAVGKHISLLKLYSPRTQTCFPVHQ